MLMVMIKASAMSSRSFTRNVSASDGTIYLVAYTGRSKYEMRPCLRLGTRRPAHSNFSALKR
jgi:hypothetical protein